jgi:DNA-directed RNA polymerase specialized sigma24 family protein
MVSAYFSSRARRAPALDGVRVMLPRERERARSRAMRLIVASGRDRAWWVKATGVPDRRLALWLRHRDGPDPHELAVIEYAAADPALAEAIATKPPPEPAAVAQLAARLGVRPEELAARFGVGLSTYYRWLSGAVMTPVRQRLFWWLWARAAA